MLAIFTLKKEPPKKNHIFKGPGFPNGWPYWCKSWRVLRDVFIAKVMSIRMSKVGQNPTAFWK